MKTYLVPLTMKKVYLMKYTLTIQLAKRSLDNVVWRSRLSHG
jgi:hypothetical protein